MTTDNKDQLHHFAWYRFGCPCCGPKDNEEHKTIRRWTRRKTKQELQVLKREHDKESHP